MLRAARFGAGREDNPRYRGEAPSDLSLTRLVAHLRRGGNDSRDWPPSRCHGYFLTRGSSLQIAGQLRLQFTYRGHHEAARRIPVLPHVLQRNSGFLARARHARGNDRKIRPSGRAVSLSCAGLNKIEVHSLGALVTNLGSSPALHFRYLELAPRAGFEPAT